MDKDADFVEFVQARSSALLPAATLLTARDRHAAEHPDRLLRAGR